MEHACFCYFVTEFSIIFFTYSPKIVMPKKKEISRRMIAKLTFYWQSKGVIAGLHATSGFLIHQEG